MHDIEFTVADLFDAVMPDGCTGAAVTTVGRTTGQTIIITAEPPDPNTGAWSIVIQGEAL